jgi:hypothetical protein
MATSATLPMSAARSIPAFRSMSSSAAARSPHVPVLPPTWRTSPRPSGRDCHRGLGRFLRLSARQHPDSRWRQRRISSEGRTRFAQRRLCSGFRPIRRRRSMPAMGRCPGSPAVSGGQLHAGQRTLSLWRAGLGFDLQLPPPEAGSEGTKPLLRYHPGPTSHGLPPCGL